MAAPDCNCEFSLGTAADVPKLYYLDAQKMLPLTPTFPGQITGEALGFKQNCQLVSCEVKYMGCY